MPNANGTFFFGGSFAAAVDVAQHVAPVVVQPATAAPARPSAAAFMKSRRETSMPFSFLVNDHLTT